MNTDDETLIETWLFRMVVEGCGEGTRTERARLMRSLAAFSGTPLIEITRHQLMQYLARTELSARTKQHYRSGFHTFYSLLQDEGIRLDNPATRLPKQHVPRLEVNPFSTAEIQQLLDSGIYGKTRLMVLLAAYQGLRAAEIAAVHGRNIDWPQRRIQVVEAKGGVVVWRPLHPIIWQEALSQPRDGFWFPNWTGNKRFPVDEGHILAASVSDLLSRALKRAGIRHRPHQLRAWHATELIDSGADTMTAQFSMRHANQSTLQRYVKPSNDRILAAMERLPKVDVPARSGRSRSD